MSSLTDKVAIVTGASKGIGSGIAMALAAAGARVAVNYPLRKEIMSFDEIVEQVPKLSVEERDALRSYLDQYEAMENDAIDEGLRSLKEEPTITFEELDRRISEKFGWK